MFDKNVVGFFSVDAPEHIQSSSWEFVSAINCVHKEFYVDVNLGKVSFV